MFFTVGPPGEPSATLRKLSLLSRVKNMLILSLILNNSAQTLGLSGYVSGRGGVGVEW